MGIGFYDILNIFLIALGIGGVLWASRKMKRALRRVYVVGIVRRKK